MRLFRRLLREEEGQTYLEYAVLLALIAIVVAVSAGWVGNAINDFMNAIATSIQAGQGGVQPLP